MLGLMRFLSVPSLFRNFSTKIPTFDCYKALGLSRSSSESEIKTAYRTLAKQHHPDSGGNSELFIKVQTAYETLISNRAAHDMSHPSSRKSEKPGNSWNTWKDTSWWDGRARSDFDETDFEEIWKKIKKKGAKRENFWDKMHFDEDSDDDDQADARRSSKRDDAYNKQAFRKERKSKFGDEQNYARPKRHPKEKVKHSPTAERIFVKSPKLTGRGFNLAAFLGGEYVRIEDFHKRPAFQMIGSPKGQKVFLFWSNKFSDWKLHKRLKDESTCLGFNDDAKARNPADIKLPWHLWNHRRGKYEQMAISIEALPSPDEDPAVMKEIFLSWSAERLRFYLDERGYACQTELFVEKSELVDLAMQDYELKRSKKPDNDKQKESKVRIASRARVDSVNMPPPSLHVKSHIHSNRVEDFEEDSEETVPEWIVRHGDRHRYYGVFVGGEFRYGLIWDKDSEWQKVYTKQVRTPLRPDNDK